MKCWKNTSLLKKIISIFDFFLILCQTPEPMYTEGDVKALKEQHAEEMQLLQEEYE